MAQFEGLRRKFTPDWQGLVANILRAGTPDRVYNMELFQDQEISAAIAARFDVTRRLRADDPHFALKKHIAVPRFSGFDYVKGSVMDLAWPLWGQTTEDVAALQRAGGRHYQDENVGPIMSWEDFEKYPWPDPHTPSAMREIEWFQKHLPDDMCIIGFGGFAHLAEMLTWLMGYQTFCYALYDQRDLVKAIADRLVGYYQIILERMLQFDRVKIIWGSDDMGHKTGLLFGPDDMREFVLTGHKRMAAMAHKAGRPYLLHSCGNLADIIDDLINDVRIDAKHSFEDTIEDVRVVKHTYGQAMALLGGIDVDFLCRADEADIRARVRETLDVCMPGGGYCLGTGNSVTNYIPLDSYLAMVDEGRLYGGWKR
jgi:uroporphyrinogen decarboxylase